MTIKSTDEALRAGQGETGVTLERLAHEALAARELAFAPHSGFKVGAALLTPGGRIVRGANVEAASYSMTNCAERVTIQKAVSEGERSFIALAVAADASYLRQGPEGAARKGLERFVTPCGACRQVLREFGDDLEIFMVNGKGEYQVQRIADLLPEAFKLK